MSEQPEQEQGPSRWWWFVFTVPVLYVLSYGPANTIARKFPATWTTLHRLYEPLSLLPEQPFKLLEKYYEFWDRL